MGDVTFPDISHEPRSQVDTQLMGNLGHQEHHKHASPVQPAHKMTSEKVAFSPCPHDW